MTAADAKEKLRALADPKIAAHSKRFFKTGPGEYGGGVTSSWVCAFPMFIK